MLPTSLDPLKDVKLNGIGGNGKSKKIVIPFNVAWRIVQDLPVMARAIVMVAAVSGLRVSEILGLRWSDLDFEGMKINLNRTWHSGGGIGEGKTDASSLP